MINAEAQQLKNIADEGKYLYKIGKITREEAKEKIMPYIQAFNEKSISIAKKYGMKPKKISFTSYIR